MAVFHNLCKRDSRDYVLGLDSQFHKCSPTILADGHFSEQRRIQPVAVSIHVRIFVSDPSCLEGWAFDDQQQKVRVKLVQKAPEAGGHSEITQH